MVEITIVAAVCLLPTIAREEASTVMSSDSGRYDLGSSITEEGSVACGAMMNYLVGRVPSSPKFGSSLELM